jgi:hypothetical protein
MLMAVLGCYAAETKINDLEIKMGKKGGIIDLHMIDLKDNLEKGEFTVGLERGKANHEDFF